MSGGGRSALPSTRERLERDGQLAAVGAHHRAGDADPIAAVEVGESGELFRAERGPVDEELDLAGAILQHAEGQPAVAADQHQPAGDRYRSRTAFTAASDDHCDATSAAWWLAS